MHSHTGMRMVNERKNQMPQLAKSNHNSIEPHCEIPLQIESFRNIVNLMEMTKAKLYAILTHFQLDLPFQTKQNACH